MSQTAPPIDTDIPEMEKKRRSTVVWVVTLCCVGMMFDGYDLVVYGAVLPIFLQPDGLAEGVTVDKAHRRSCSDRMPCSACCSAR